MDLHEVLIHGPFDAPHLGQKGLPGPDSPRRPGQGFQEIKFSAGQSQLDAVNGGRPAFGLNHQRTVPEDAGVLATKGLSCRDGWIAGRVAGRCVACAAARWRVSGGGGVGDRRQRRLPGDAASRGTRLRMRRLHEA